MLSKQTVSPATLELLKKLMDDPLLSNFFLVGGTALSLQIGHRISIDLDFFTTSGFDENGLLEAVESEYGFQLDFRQKNTIKGRIGDVKVDFIAHQYPLIETLLIDEGVRMAGLRDIAAMKLNAITGRGTRVKDFIDVAYLSSYLTPAQILEAYQAKYVDRNPLMAIKSLTYHNDIDSSEPVEMIDTNFSWPVIEERLNDMLKDPGRQFDLITFQQDPKRRLKR